MEHQANKERMKNNWNANNGVQPLINQINAGLLYAMFSWFSISGLNTVNMGWHVILKIGLFKMTYTEWPVVQRLVEHGLFA